MKKNKGENYNLYKMIKNSIMRFPLTIITIFILTIVIVININSKFIDETVFTNIMLCGLLFGISTLLIDTFSKSRFKKNILFYIISFLISLTLTYLVNIKGSFLGISHELFMFRMTRLIMCYLVSLVLLIIYFSYRRSKKTLSKYLTHVVINLLKTSLIYGIIAIGVSLIEEIFNTLFLNGTNYTLLLSLETLIFGVYYLPQVIYSFSNTDNEINKFFKVVIKYVLGILVIIAFVIIYLYIFKIIILRSVPSNQIYRILSTLFVLGCPIWTMVETFEENDILDKINKKLPLFFIPFIFLQIYSIVVRIINNGLTEARYLCIVLIIVEIIYLVIYIKNKKQMGNMLIVLVVFTIVSTIFPYINMFKLSQLSQYNNLKIYKQKSSYTEKEMVKIRGAYYYLNQYPDAKEDIEKLLTKDDINKILSFKCDNKCYKQNNNQYIYANTNLSNIDVEGYKTLNLVRAHEYYPSSESIDDCFKSVYFNIENSDEELVLDLSSEVKKYIDNKDNIRVYLKDNYEVVIDNKRKLLIKNISFTYDKEKNTVEQYTISGYLLER